MSNIYNPNHKTEKVFARVGVKSIIINNDDKFLILKRSDKMNRESGKWSLPGGSTDILENPKQTVVREIKEETGLEVSNVKPFETTSHEYDTDFIIVIGYTCQTLENKVEINWEHDDYIWITQTEALSMDLTELTRFFILKYGDIKKSL